MLRPRFVLLLLLAATAATAAAAAACPTDLPGGCACKESEGRLSISCVSTPLAAVLPKLANRPVDSLRLVNCSVPALERPITLTGLRTLELAHCGIGRIDPKALSPVADSLEELSFADNRLTAVPEGLKVLPRLARLTLNRNLISSFPSGVFSFAPALVELRAEDNRVCALAPGALEEIKPTLALLDLSGNCLASLAGATALRSAPALAYLDLSGNKLTEVAPLSLLSLPSLVEARLSDNLLTRLAPLALSGTPELRYLYLQNNLLDSVAALPALERLEILDARANRLTKVPSLVDSPVLRQLRLDANRLAAVESRALARHPKLQLLSVQDNAISSLSADSFEGLSELVVLLLANNRLPTLERAPLTPLRSLQQLSVRNNSIADLEGDALSPLKQLTTLDMGENALAALPKGIFEPLPKLFWVDVSGNALASFEKGALTKRISNLLLGDNPLNCDESLDWFVQWLVVNRVRTFLPGQPEVVCSAPPSYEGTKLRDLMIKKANETMKVIGLQPEKPKAGQALVNNLLPGMSLMHSLVPAGQQAAAGLGQVPGLGALLNGIPSLRNLPLAPGVGGNGAAAAGGGAQGAPAVRSMNSALEQFAAPLVRFATGGQPQAADFEQLMQSIPKMIEAAPGGAAAVIDVSKLSPDVIAHVLRGGQIPGIPRDTLERLVSGHVRRMAEVATAIARGEQPTDVEKYLPPLDRLPSELISSVMSGQSLPGLAPDQMDAIKQYYLSTLPLASSSPSAPALTGAAAADGGAATSSGGSAPATSSGSGAGSGLPASFPLTPQTLEMLQLLPTGYDISRIPMEILSAISKGEVPDLRLLPADLQEHLKSNTDKMFRMLQGGGAGGASSAMATANGKQDLREVLEKLPRWERPSVESVTYSPYDLNNVKTDAAADQRAAAQAAMYRTMTAGVIGLLALVTVIVVVSMCVAQRRKLARHGGALVETSGETTSTIDNMRAASSSTPTILSEAARLSSLQATSSMAGGRVITHRRSPQQNM